jgi:peptide/nickel transport system permease protein
MATTELGKRIAIALPPDRSSLSARWAYAMRSLRRSPVGLLGISLVALLLFCATIGPMITPHDPTARNLRGRFQPPGYVDEQRGTFWLGTDQLGRDVFSRIVVGSRISVVVGIASVLIAGAIGVVYGLMAGFLGGSVDAILMRIADAFLAIPFIVLVVAVAGIVGAGLVTLILILGFTGWVTYSRIVRSEVLVLRAQEFIVAARVIGQSSPLIMFRHILPNVWGSVIVLATLQVGTSILAEASLSFLGLGVEPTTITWGIMLADGREYVGSAWWLTTFPGIAITLTVLGVSFLGDWLRDVLDPRLRE